ncbi:MAG: DUF560 domain-containing protein [Sulfurovum sp.]|nr:DUF560 domain-containing protein [Sulfurovum sp.]
MKKIVGFLLTAQITLFAGISALADIQTMYDQGKYDMAIAEARQSTEKFGDPDLHLLWAKSAEALGQDEMAMSAYERVLMLDPDNVEVRVHLASLYANSERDELALEMSKSTENYQLTPAQRNSLDTLKKADRDDLKIAATLGIGYDSNINVSPDDIDIINSGKSLSTMFSQFSAQLSYTHGLKEYKDWYIRTDADLFYQYNFDSEADDYNMFAGAMTLGLGYRSDKYDILFPVKYGRLHYLNRDFMETIGVEPRINITLTPSLIGTLNARYTDRTYLDNADKNRNDTILGYGGGLYWLFDKNFVYLKSNYDDYRAEYSDSLLFTEKETLNLSVGINYDVYDWFIARLDYRYRYTLYGDFLPNGEKQREDNYHQGELKVSKMFLDTVEGSLLYRYSTNGSNYDLAEYDKDIVIFGLQYNF